MNKTKYFYVHIIDASNFDCDFEVILTARTGQL